MGNLTKNFSRAEFEASSTAKKHNIDNTIPDKYKYNLIRLANMLQIIRDKYGLPIKIGSGYRCPAVNKLVGGVANSQHLVCSAADIHSVSDSLKDNKELWDVIISMANNKEIDARQIIWEYGKKEIGPNWIHIAVNDKQHNVRHNQIVFIGV